MKDKYMNAKKIIVITMCTLICIMAVGYAAFSTKLTITGTSSIESTWNVEFTKIEEVSKTSGITITNPPTASGTTATFNVDLTSPGDNIIYRITVANNGTLNAIIDNITASETGSDAIKFEITGIKKGDKLASKTTTTFDVTISYDNSVTSQPTTTNNKLTVDINYVQDMGQTITSEDVEIVTSSLRQKILKDSTPHPLNAAAVYGAGLYEVNENTEDGKTTYIFSGKDVNNFLSFAGKIWRIVRINEDGTIRIILNGSAGTSAFNTSSTNYFNPLVGYMYGTATSSNVTQAHANVNSSTIKTFLDNWYTSNLLRYSSYIADSGFCGDRTYTSGSILGNLDAVYTSSGSVLSCPQESDLYTTTTSTKGNKALTNPIGLITKAEFMYTTKAGSTYMANLLTASSFWTMTPDKYSNGTPYVEVIYSGMGLASAGVSTSAAVVPVINLNSNVLSSGNGSVTTTYLIK